MTNVSPVESKFNKKITFSEKMSDRVDTNGGFQQDGSNLREGSDSLPVLRKVLGNSKSVILCGPLLRPICALWCLPWCLNDLTWRRSTYTGRNYWLLQAVRIPAGYKEKGKVNFHKFFSRGAQYTWGFREVISNILPIALWSWGRLSL